MAMGSRKKQPRWWLKIEIRRLNQAQQMCVRRG